MQQQDVTTAFSKRSVLNFRYGKASFERAHKTKPKREACVFAPYRRH